MKKLFFCVCVLCTHGVVVNSQSNCYGDEAYTELDANNIRAGLMQSGSLWWDGSDARYFAPDDGSGVAAIFAGGVWAGGITPDSTVRVAATEYGHGGAYVYDYYPGPLHPSTGNAYPNGCDNWNKFFTIYHSEKEQHLADFADNGVIDNPVASIFGWPGRNNPYFSQYNQFAIPANLDLAPFVDVNGDNIYDPSAGDYPDTKGDQAIWWVFNDVAAPHTNSNGDAIGLEIQAMAYAFQSFEPAINNATFYDFKVNYKGDEPLTDFNFAIWADVDLGCYTDDYIGFNEEYDMAFYYNSDVQDGNNGTNCFPDIPTYGDDIPMLGIKLMTDSDEVGVSSYTFYHGTGTFDPPAPETSPTVASEYYNYMTNRWRDGSPTTYGSNGYCGTTPTPYVFPTDPSDEEGWSMCTATTSNAPVSSRRTIMSTQSPTTLNYGDTKEYSYAVIFVPDVPHPCPSLDMLRSAADVVDNFDCIVSDVDEVLEIELEMSIDPNPASTNILISLEGGTHILDNLEIIDLQGRVISRKKNVNVEDNNLDVSDLSRGVYFLKVITREGKRGAAKLVIQ